MEKRIRDWCNWLRRNRVCWRSLVFDLRPLFFPAVGADDIANGQHGIDMVFCPMHPRTFQACFDHQLIATFHDATSNGPTLRLKLWVLHLLFAFFQVGQIA